MSLLTLERVGEPRAPHRGPEFTGPFCRGPRRSVGRRICQIQYSQKQDNAPKSAAPVIFTCGGTIERNSTGASCRNCKANYDELAFTPGRGKHSYPGGLNPRRSHSSKKSGMI